MSKQENVSNVKRNLLVLIGFIEHAIDAELSTSIFVRPIDGRIDFREENNMGVFLTWQLWVMIGWAIFAFIFMEEVINLRNPGWYWFLGWMTHSLFCACVPGF